MGINLGIFSLFANDAHSLPCWEAVLGAGLAHQYYALTLHPLELGAPSKKCEHDESVLLDQSYSSSLSPLLVTLAWAFSLA